MSRFICKDDHKRLTKAYDSLIMCREVCFLKGALESVVCKGGLHEIN